MTEPPDVPLSARRIRELKSEARKKFPLATIYLGRALPCTMFDRLQAVSEPLVVDAVKLTANCRKKFDFAPVRQSPNGSMLNDSFSMSVIGLGPHSTPL
jgi:hypothetical protein